MFSRVVASRLQLAPNRCSRAPLLQGIPVGVQRQQQRSSVREPLVELLLELRILLAFGAAQGLRGSVVALVEDGKSRQRRQQAQVYRCRSLRHERLHRFPVAELYRNHRGR